MVAKLSRKVKHDALLLDASDMKQADITKTLGISKSTLTRAKRKLKTTGDIEGGVKKRGRKPKLDQGMKDVNLTI
jgi:transposase